MAISTTLPASRQNRVVASPRARRLMRQLGLNPRSIAGSGPEGRIIERDVRNQKTAGAAAASPGISVMRRAIAEKTAASFASVPHFYLRAEADVTELLILRQDLAKQWASRGELKPTLTDFLLRAMVLAVPQFPFANQVWQNGSIVTLPTVDLGLVVGLADGLLIPVLRRMDRLTLAEAAKRRADAVTAARAGRLGAADTQGAAMSLSNLGNSPVDEFAAVIAPGQSSMLAVGRAAPRPFVVKDQLAVRTTLRLCLSADHRVMDGAPAADFLGRIVELLEKPSQLVAAPDTPASA